MAFRATPPVALGASPSEEENLAWLFGFADQERGAGWNPRAQPDEQWKLGRTRALLDIAGAPDRAMVCVLVAGTNGKGSTAALLASILHASGLRAGLYTQPHLQTYRERIRIDGQAVAFAAFHDALRSWQQYVERLKATHPEAGEPTTFEITTAMAIDIFASSGCRVAILEVGLGGRLDATNAVEPSLAIITSLGRDHMAILGSRIEQIAREKAGIFRPRQQALSALQTPTAARELRRVARGLKVDLAFIPPLPASTWHEAGAEGRGQLCGAYQAQNAALAIEAARSIVRDQCTRELDDESTRQGVQQLRWPGRFEVISGSPTIVLDGAHNEPAARALTGTLSDYAGGRDVGLVLGLLRDKDAPAILRHLVPVARTIAVTTPRNARGRAGGDLARLVKKAGGRLDGEHSSVGDALSAMRASFSPDGLVCVTGSLALVGEAREALGLPPVERLWD